MLKTKISKCYDFWIFEPVEPRIYPFYYTRMLQEIQENDGAILEKYYFGKCETKYLEYVGNCAYLPF